MTELLVSVRDAGEAEEALAGGANWIDLKEPTRGALGAVDAAVAHDVVRHIAGRAPISVAGGELRDWPASPARQLLGVPGWSHLKLGLSGMRDAAWRPAWRTAAREAAAKDVALVAVIYADDANADSPPAAEIVELAVEASCLWLLIDTFDKTTTLSDHEDSASLRALLSSARARGLRTAVAGRLTPSLMRALPMECIDMVGVRSAACGGTRTGLVDRGNVAMLCQLLSEVSPREAICPR